jgi:hypothetical protein
MKTSPRLSRVRSFVPSARVVRRSASCALASWSSAAVSVSVRSSASSLSACVCVVCFSSFAAASAFARSWGRRLPPVCRGCRVRRVPAGWAVSVPVCFSLPV